MPLQVEDQDERETLMGTAAQYIDFSKARKWNRGNKLFHLSKDRNRIDYSKSSCPHVGYRLYLQFATSVHIFSLDEFVLSCFLLVQPLLQTEI